MKTTLIFPPFTDATQPAQALPSLAVSVEDLCAVDVWDVNLDAWDYFLGARCQRRMLSRIERKLARLECAKARSARERAEILQLLDAALRGSASLGELEAAQRCIRSEAFFDPGSYDRAMRTIQGALATVSACFRPSTLEWGRFCSAAPVDSSAEIARECTRRATNPFVEFVDDVVIGGLRARRPDLIGISLTYLDQVVPAFTIAAACRRVAPRTPVIMGGQVVSLWGEALRTNHALWRFVDAFVLNEGEGAIRRIVAEVAGGRRLPVLKNVVVRPHRRAAYPGHVEGDDAALSSPVARCPDYSRLPLERYLSPEPVLTVSSSRGCYWGRCAFCSVSPAFRSGFLEFPGENVVENIDALGRRCGARLFMFGDDALPVRFVRSLVRGECVLPEGVRWQAETRWEGVPDLATARALRRSGALNLVFGLESASDTVLARMRKGSDIAKASRSLRSCLEAGIGVNLQCFLGFPGERRKDALMTYSFLRRRMSREVTVSCGIFQLQKGSPVWRDPGAFGVRILAGRKPRDLAVSFDFEPRRGAQWREKLRSRVATLSSAAAPQMRSGFGAHALIFMARPGREPAREPKVGGRSGPARLRLSEGVSWRTTGWDLNSLEDGQRPRRRRTTLAFVLTSGRVFELGPIAAEILKLAKREPELQVLRSNLSTDERRCVQRAIRMLRRQGLLAHALEGAAT